MPFWRSRPPRTVVKTYGRDSLIALVNPLLALMARTFGFQLRLKPEDRVALEMERDAIAMLRKGYRVVSSQQFEIAPFGATWHKVTYELADGPPSP
jgi:hypothetical protein